MNHAFEDLLVGSPHGGAGGNCVCENEIRPSLLGRGEQNNLSKNWMAAAGERDGPSGFLFSFLPQDARRKQRAVNCV